MGMRSSAGAQPLPEEADNEILRAALREIVMMTTSGDEDVPPPREVNAELIADIALSALAGR